MSKTQEDTQVFQIKIAFVPIQHALIRISATSEEMALAGLREMTDGVVHDLTVEDIEAVDEDAPVPEEYDEENPQTTTENVDTVVPLKKTMH